MDQMLQIKKIIHEEIAVVDTDLGLNAEDTAIERLVEEAGLTEDEAKEYIEKFYFGNL